MERLTDKEFIKYLVGKLLYIDDCCSYCAFNPIGELCVYVDNQERCVEGIRQYAEKHYDELTNQIKESC